MVGLCPESCKFYCWNGENSELGLEEFYFFDPDRTFLDRKVFFALFKVPALSFGETFLGKLFDTLLRLVYRREDGH